MSDPKEHRIPIRVSRVLKLLQGDEAEREATLVMPIAKDRPTTTSPAPIKKDEVSHQPPQKVGDVVHHNVSVPSASLAQEILKESTKEEDVLVSNTPVMSDIPVEQKLEPIISPESERTQMVVADISEIAMQTPPMPVLIEGVDVARLHVAYFCMEVGLSARMPFYSGGLGVLAGDMLKSAADLDVPMIGVTLLYRDGYFTQRIDASGWQEESPVVVHPEEYLKLLPHTVKLVLEERAIVVRAWLYEVKGYGGGSVPVIFLDTDCEENHVDDRALTHQLYGGDPSHRLKQEAILGIAGMRMLEAIGATHIAKYHMNEGHSALLTIELYKRFSALDRVIDTVRAHTVFTTHTPVAAGHDRFDLDTVARVLGTYIPSELHDIALHNGALNMTRLGLELSAHINGVAKRHGEVTQELFPGYHINSITNGVHARTWVSLPMHDIFAKYLPGWEGDPMSLRYALSIPSQELWDAHLCAKRQLLRTVKERTGVSMKEDIFTIGFARRATAYKRWHMLFADVERLARIAGSSRGIQIIYSGKAHPKDHEGKLIIQRIINAMHTLGLHHVTCAYIEDYNMDLAAQLVAGVDLWLNTPSRPQEASGTSGMKAALNGVPQLSILDGWWIEGHIEDATGWSVGPHPEQKEIVPEKEEIDELYTKLQYVILPKFYEDRESWIRIMRQTIAINGSFFNTHRMLEQYVTKAYFI